MDLICVENYSMLVSNFGGLLLLGIVLGCITILPLADIYGRRKMLFIASNICLAAFMLNFYAWHVSQDLFQLKLSLFLIGLSKVSQLMVCYVLSAELNTSDQVPMATAAVEGMIGLMGVILCLYLKYYQEVQTTLVLSIVTLAVYPVFLYYYSVESPAYLLKSG